MRRDYRKRHDSEMLAVRKPPGPGRSTADEAARTREAAEELARLRAMVASTSDPAERKVLLAELQDRFGNEAARETIARLRAGAEGGA